MRYEVLEHTADQALRATGRDLRELIENAAAGMISLLYAAAPPPPERELERTIAADSPELLVHHSLRELLYLLEDEDLAPVGVRVVAATDAQATLQVGVIPRAAAEPLLGALLKAVTRHGLNIERDADLLGISIVFDV